MKRSGRTVALVAVAVLAMTACSKTSSEDSGDKANPATIEKIAGSEGARVTLTDTAIERIGLETAVVKAAPAGSSGAQRAMANAAVLYDPTGRTWAYVSTAHGTYVRTPITVVRIVGDDALLSDGPPSGAEVVTVGAAELFGAESTFGED